MSNGQLGVTGRLGQYPRIENDFSRSEGRTLVQHFTTDQPRLAVIA